MINGRKNRMNEYRSYQTDFSSKDKVVREVGLEELLDLGVHLEDHHQVYLDPLNQAMVDPHDRPDLTSNCCEQVDVGHQERPDLPALPLSQEVEEEYCCYRWADYFATRGTVDIVDTAVPLSPGAVVEDCHCLSVGLGVYLD